MKIQCNETHLQIDEMNRNEGEKTLENNMLTWKFAHPSLFCRAKQKVEAAINECGIQSIDDKYLKVRLMRTIRTVRANSPPPPFGSTNNRSFTRNIPNIMNMLWLIVQSM